MKVAVMRSVFLMVILESFVRAQIKLSPDINKKIMDCLQSNCTTDELRKALKESVEERAHLRQKVEELTLEVTNIASDALFLIEWKKDQIDLLEKDIEVCRNNYTRLYTAYETLEKTLLNGLTRLESGVDRKLHNHWLNATQTCREMCQSGLFYTVRSVMSDILESLHHDCQYIHAITKRYTTTLYGALRGWINNTKNSILSSACYKYACGAVNEYLLSDSGLQLLARIDFAHRKIVYSAYRLRIISDEVYRKCVAVVVKSLRCVVKHSSDGVRYSVTSLQSIPAIRHSLDADLLEKIIYFIIYLVLMFCLWLCRASVWKIILFLLWPVLAPLESIALRCIRRKHQSTEDAAMSDNQGIIELSRKWGIDKKHGEDE